MRVKVNLDVSKLDTITRQKKAMQAAQELEVVLNSKEFKDMVLAMPDKWRAGESSKFKNYNAESIYKMIMDGKEEWNNTVDNELDILIDDYYSIARVVGYMNPNKPTIFVNTKYFDTNSKKNIGSNFLHEYMHTLGFRHSGANLRSSIPYFMNYVYETVYDKVVKGVIVLDTTEKWETVCRRNWYTPWKKTCYRVRVD